MQSEQLVKTWICDSCGQLIQKPEDGWVEWIVSVPTNKAYDLRLVHHTGSGLNGRSYEYQAAAVRQKYDGIIADFALPMLLGADGLMKLLILLTEKCLQQEQILEMIKRLHIPGYEHAGCHFKEAIGAAVFEPNTPPGFYWQHDINTVLKWLGSKNQ